MKRLLFLPLLALPLLFVSCDRQLPTNPETRSIDDDPLFAKTIPNTVHDYAALRLNLNYSKRNEYLKATVAVKNVSVITCGEREASVAILYRPCCDTGAFTSFHLVQGVCDEPGGGGTRVVHGESLPLTPGAYEFWAVVNDAQPTPDPNDNAEKVLTVR